MNINTSYRFTRSKLTPKKYDDTYAGNPNNNPTSTIKPIYHYTRTRDYYHFDNNTLLITELQPTLEQISLLTNPHITIIYTPDPNTVIIRNLKTRQQYFKDFNGQYYQENPTKPLTRKYIFNQILASTTKAISIHFYQYNNPKLNFYETFQHLIHQAAIHHIKVTFEDHYTYFKQTIPADTFIYSHSIIQPHDEELFYNLMQPYHSYLSQLKPKTPRHSEPKPLDKPFNKTFSNFLTYRLPSFIQDLPQDHHIQFKNFITQTQDTPDSINTYIHAWAPAYSVPTDQLPTDSYNYDTILTYLTLKYYEFINEPINDDYTICTHCNKPHLNELTTCPHCDAFHDPDDEIILDDLDNCPICYTPNKPMTHYCNHCGYDILNHNCNFTE